MAYDQFSIADLSQKLGLRIVEVDDLFAKAPPVSASALLTDYLREGIIARSVGVTPLIARGTTSRPTPPFGVRWTCDALVNESEEFTSRRSSRLHRGPPGP